MGRLLDAAHRLKRKLIPARPPMRCSACDSVKSDAARFISGPGVFLCGVCVQDASADAPDPAQPRPAPVRCSFCGGFRPLASFANGSTLKACTVCMQQMKDMMAEDFKRRPSKRVY